MRPTLIITVPCFFTWKTARIFLQDKRKALLLKRNVFKRKTRHA